MTTLREKYSMIRHTLTFYANKNNYLSTGGSQSVERDGGQRAREILEIINGPETEEKKQGQET